MVDRRQTLAACCGALALLALVVWPPWLISTYRRANVNGGAGIMTFSGLATIENAVAHRPIWAPNGGEPFEVPDPNQPSTGLSPRRYWALSYDRTYAIHVERLSWAAALIVTATMGCMYLLRRRSA